MSVDKEETSYKMDVEIRTRNPVHEYDFRWNIDNATKFSRRLNSHEFPEESSCTPKFRLVAKFNEKYPEVLNVNIGLQRIDTGKEMIHMSVDIALENVKGLVYRSKKLSSTIGGDGSPCYIFSELFSSSPSKLKFQTSFSCDDKIEFSEAQKNGLVGTYKNEDEIFVLPSDVLVIKGTIKSHGCCVVTETLAPKEILDEMTRMSHISQLLMDLQNAYQEHLFTDVELIVDDDSILVHRFVLCLRSPVFRRMFDHDTQENSSGKIYITDAETQVLENFVWYLYTGIVKEEPWDFMCALYAVAEKYEVFCLRNVCSLILTTLIDSYSVCEILKLADLYYNDSLKRSALDYLTLHFSDINSNPEWKSIINSNQKLAAEVLTEVSLNVKGKV